MRSAVCVLALAACGADTASVVVDLFEPARCAEFCVTELSATVDGVGQPAVACGVPLQLGTVEVGRSIALRVVAQTPGGELVAQGTLTAVSGERVSAELAFLPSSTPNIDTVTPERTNLLGATDLTIEGEDFGPEGVGAVTVGGAPATVRSWSDTSIVVTTDEIGDVVVSRCGVDSDPAPSLLTPLDLTILQPLPLECEAGRLVSGGAVLSEGFPDAAMGLFDCAVDSCGPALIARMEGDLFAERWGPLHGCATALSVAEAATPFVVVGSALQRCALGAPGTPPTCLTRVADRVRQVSAIGTTNAAYTRTGTAGEQLYVINDGGTERIAIDNAVAIDRRSALSASAAGSRLMTWRSTAGHAIEVDLPVMCATPRLIGSSGVGGRRVIVVVCERDGGSEVRAFDLAAMSTGPIASVYARGLVADAVQVSVDGSVIVLWSRGGGGASGALMFIDVARRAVMARRPLPASYPGAAFLRAPFSNTYYLGGPGLGQVTRIRLP